MNLFADLPCVGSQELIEAILRSGSTRIERIVSHGHASPHECWYDQPESEWVIVLRGAARLRFEDRVIEMGPGDYVDIPAHTRHRVEWTTPEEQTVWLAVHYGPEASASAMSSGATIGR